MDINHILEEHSKCECPDITRLANMLGFTVNLVDTNKKFRSILHDKQIFIREDVMISGRKFLVAYHLSDYILRGTENSIIYLDQLYDEEVYEYAVDLIIPHNRLSKNLKNIDKECQKYDVSPSIILNKINRKSRR